MLLILGGGGAQIFGGECIHAQMPVFYVLLSTIEFLELKLNLCVSSKIGCGINVDKNPFSQAIIHFL